MNTNRYYKPAAHVTERDLEKIGAAITAIRHNIDYQLTAGSTHAERNTLCKEILYNLAEVETALLRTVLITDDVPF